MRLRFKPLRPVTALDSPWNRGWLYGVVVGGAAVLLILIVSHLAILLTLIGLL